MPLSMLAKNPKKKAPLGPCMQKSCALVLAQEVIKNMLVEGPAH